jgi:hypothetical protein
LSESLSVSGSDDIDDLLSEFEMQGTFPILSLYFSLSLSLNKDIAVPLYLTSAAVLQQQQQVYRHRRSSSLALPDSASPAYVSDSFHLLPRL